MLRSMIFAPTVSLGVAPMAFAADTWTVKSVDVTTDLAAVANPTRGTSNQSGAMLKNGLATASGSLSNNAP